MEEGGGWLLLLPPLEIRVHNGAGFSAAVEIADEVGPDAIVQEGRQGDVAERGDGQAIRRERGSQNGGAEGRDNEVVIICAFLNGVWWGVVNNYVWWLLIIYIGNLQLIYAPIISEQWFQLLSISLIIKK